MHKFPQSPLFWLAILCAALSAGLWNWSRRLPESNWESTASLSPSATEPDPAIGTYPAPPLNTDSSETNAAAAATPALIETSAPGLSSAPMPADGVPEKLATGEVTTDGDTTI